jgi:hypothetical protein
MADYVHLSDDHVLTVELTDGSRTYPASYRVHTDGGWLHVLPPASGQWLAAVAGFRLDRVRSFDYSGHELGRVEPIIEDPLDLLNGPLSEHEAGR